METLSVGTLDLGIPDRRGRAECQRILGGLWHPASLYGGDRHAYARGALRLDRERDDADVRPAQCLGLHLRAGSRWRAPPTRRQEPQDRRFRVQRLTTEVESTRREIGDLRQTVTSTVSNSLQVLVGTVRTAADDLRATFRAQRSALDRVRYALPNDSQTTGQLEIIDGIARQIYSDDLDLEELIRAIGIMRSLVAQAS